MTIQDLPPFFDMQCTEKGEKLSPDFYLYNDQMFQALNNLMSFFNQCASTLLVDIPALQAVGINAPALLGINPPSFTTAQINAIYAVSPSIVPVGTIWYNSTTDQLQFKGASAIQTITSV